MDPSLFGVVHELAPVGAALIFFACPVALYWLKKNHQLRMRELELEMQGSTRIEHRLDAIEQRLSGIESAVGARTPQLPAPERAALMEGPGAVPAPIRQR